MITKELPYQKNSAAIFEQLKPLSHPIFLDSGGLGRFDILAAAPEVTITVNHQITTVTDRQGQQKLNTDPFEATLTQLKRYNPPKKITTNEDLPFRVGAIGYMGYDISKQLEKLPNTAQSDIQIPQAVIGIYHWSIVVDHEKRKLFLNALDEDTLSSLEWLIARLTSSLLEPQKSKTFSVTPFTSNLTHEQYAQKFQTIKKHIVEGDTYQINFAQRFRAEYSGDPWQGYLALRKTHPAPFSGFFLTSDGAILCCSPERFLKVVDQAVETKPIKGTTPRFNDPIKDKQSADKLINSQKDQAENLMIVDLMRNDLSKVCQPGSVLTPQICALESFSNVHHLVSTVKGQLKPNHHAMTLFKNCFPGGSITGAPKVSAMKIIDAIEPHHRSVYCGSLFYADISGSFDSNIAIRTMICDQQFVYCYGGGGIVYDSVCDKEYEETFAKVGKMLQTLDQFIC